MIIGTSLSRSDNATMRPSPADPRVGARPQDEAAVSVSVEGRLVRESDAPQRVNFSPAAVALGPQSAGGSPHTPAAPARPSPGGGSRPQKEHFPEGSLGQFSPQSPQGGQLSDTM
jgi:hypothetical protein